jgi:hypothetical protein
MYYLLSVSQMVFPGFDALGKLAHVVVAVPGAAEGVAHPLLGLIHSLAGAGLGGVHLAVALKGG